ncbi:hypothetical protein TNCV_1063911 [Trichonephila clavipes]|nr:hypothetical protein TNCV_1063911 [Trichonephila clavipes]
MFFWEFPAFGEVTDREEDISPLTPDQSEKLIVFRKKESSPEYRNNMLTKYQMIKFIDFCEVWFLPESLARVAAIVGDHRCHTPRH